MICVHPPPKWHTYTSLISTLLLLCSSPGHGAVVFTTRTNETKSIPAVDGLPWTDVTPAENLPVIHITKDTSIFDFCDADR